MQLPAGQQLVARDKWPIMGERSPRASDVPWQVELAGLVAHPRVYTLSDLQAMPSVEQTIDIHCVTRWSKLGVRFRGVPLATLLERAKPGPRAGFVSLGARSERNHSTSLVLQDALALETLVALEADGVPLAADRGGPVRVVVPGRYFYKSVKWLERIELLATDRLGYWEATAGYHNTADPWREQRYIASGISKSEAAATLALRDWTGRELRSLDARERDLSGLVARNALLRDADFRGSRLAGASFEGANLTNAHFERAVLAEATFRGADLEGANFAGADLRGACLLEVSLLGASFCETDGGLARGATFDQRTQFSAAALADLPPAQQAYAQTALQAAAAQVR